MFLFPVYHPTRILNPLKKLKLKRNSKDNVSRGLRNIQDEVISALALCHYYKGEERGSIPLKSCNEIFA